MAGRATAPGMRAAAALLATALLAGVSQALLARDRASAPPGEVAATELPGEAAKTLERIRRGGPFPYRRDGVVFGNRERRLPAQPPGYYREYTVPTPGASDRGARRIVAGAGAAGDVRASGEYYYSEDHYRSFRRITGVPR